MSNFVFAYRVPQDFTPGNPETVAAWYAWREDMGAAVADMGKPVLKSAAIGECGPGTRLGGYSLIAADDLDAALVLAKGCPVLQQGGGVEVGVLGGLSPRSAGQA